MYTQTSVIVARRIVNLDGWVDERKEYSGNPLRCDKMSSIVTISVLLSASTKSSRSRCETGVDHCTSGLEVSSTNREIQAAIRAFVVLPPLNNVEVVTSSLGSRALPYPYKGEDRT